MKLDMDDLPGQYVLYTARYGLDDRGAGVRVPVESRMFTSPFQTNRAS
jgi:hypothetical protein